jgi:hypothetical protein
MDFQLISRDNEIHVAYKNNQDQISEILFVPEVF